MKTWKKIISLLFVLALVVFSLSNAGDLLGALGGNRISFENGAAKADEEHLTMVLQPGETALLDSFENLRSVDLSGSTNYDEIDAWAAAHPGVSVKYTIQLPNGQSVDNSSSQVSLSGLRHEDVGSALDLLKHLPNLAAVSLGSSGDSASPITREDLASIQAFVPGGQVDYSVRFLGKDYSITDSAADLSGLTSAQIPEAVAALGFLPSLTDLTIGSNATENGELSWEDIGTLADAFPAAGLHYEFTVCGNNASMSDTSLNLTAMTSADVDKVCNVLKGMKQLQTIDLGDESSGLSSADILRIGECTDAAINYSFSLYGKALNLSDEVWDFNHIEMADNGESVRAWAKLATSLRVLDMDSCGVDNAHMAVIRDENPDCEVIWRVWFGSNYSVRTNVTKILASKPSKGGALGDSVGEQLKYCTKVRYLDLGHNDGLGNFSFVENMPDLEIAVISMSCINDLTPFSKCPNLLYLEAGNTRISDLSPLAACTKLAHLNVGTCQGVSDISPIYDLPLKRLWLGVVDPVPSDQVAKMRELHPGCIVNTTAGSGYEILDDLGNVSEGYTADGWKSYQKYLADDWTFYANNNNTFPAQRPLGYFKVIYKAFEYNLAENAYAFSWNDPKLEAHDSSVQPVNTFVLNTDFLSGDFDYETYDNATLIPDVLTDPPGEVLTVGEY